MDTTAVAASTTEFEGDVSPTLEALFGSRAEVRILGYLIDTGDTGVPHRQYDIADAIGMSEATVSRTVQKFTDLGVVEQTDDGVCMANTAISGSLITIAAEADADAELLAAGRFDNPRPIDANDPAYSYSASPGSPTPNSE